MVEVRDLTEVTLGHLWREVKSEDDWWGDVKERRLLTGWLAYGTIVIENEKHRQPGPRHSGASADRTEAVAPGVDPQRR